MKVPVRNQSINTTPLLYGQGFAAASQYDSTVENTKADADHSENRWTDSLLISRYEDEQSENNIQDAAGNDGKNPKVSCSLPDDSTGQLAAMLARAETKMDVQQVSSKAVRALSALKMASVFAEGDDAKKAAQRIRQIGRASCRERV